MCRAWREEGQKGRGLLGSWPLELQEEGPVVTLGFCRGRGRRQGWEVFMTSGEHKSVSRLPLLQAGRTDLWKLVAPAVQDEGGGVEQRCG